MYKRQCNSTTVQDDTKQLESALWRSCQLGMQVKQFRMNIHNWNHLSEKAVNWACKSVTTQQFRTTQYTTGIISVKKLSIGPERVKQHNSLGWHNTQLESAQWRSCQHITYWLIPLHQQCPAIISMALIFVIFLFLDVNYTVFKAKAPHPFPEKQRK